MLTLTFNFNVSRCANLRLRLRTYGASFWKICLEEIVYILYRNIDHLLLCKYYRLLFRMTIPEYLAMDDRTRVYSLSILSLLLVSAYGCLSLILFPRRGYWYTLLYNHLPQSDTVYLYIGFQSVSTDVIRFHSDSYVIDDEVTNKMNSSIIFQFLKRNVPLRKD